MILFHKFDFNGNLVIEQNVNNTEKKRTGNSGSARDALEDYCKQFEDNLSKDNIKAAAISLRFFSELFVKEYCAATEVNVEDVDASERINLLCSKGIVSKETADSLHTLRKIGNSGAHDEESSELERLYSNGDEIRLILLSLIREYDVHFNTRLQKAKDVFRNMLGSFLQIKNSDKIIIETGLKGCYYDKERDAQAVFGRLSFQGVPSVKLLANFEVSNLGGDKIRISSIRITSCDGKLLLLSSGADGKDGIWAKETKLQSDLYSFLRANDPYQDMTESYYEKKYYSSDDFNILYALIDVLASMPNQAISLFDIKALISVNGLSILTKKQKKDLIDLARMSHTFVSISTFLHHTLVGEEAKKMQGVFFYYTTYWSDINIFGSINKECKGGFEERDYFFDAETPVVLISNHFEKLGFHLGYKYVSKKEQYLILLSTANVPIKSFRIKVSEKSFSYPPFTGLENVDIDYIYSTKFDYDAFFKECMEQGFLISAATRMNQKAIKDIKSANRVVTSRDRKRKRARGLVAVAILIFGIVLYGLIQNEMREREREARRKNQEFMEQITADLKKAEDEEYQIYRDTFISSPEEALTYMDELLSLSDAYFEETDISKMLREEYEKKAGETQYSYKVLGWYFLQRKEIEYDVTNNRLGIVYEQSVTKPNNNFGPIYQVFEFDNLRMEDGIFKYDIVGACDDSGFISSFSRTDVAYYYNSHLKGHALIFPIDKDINRNCILLRHIDIELSRGEAEVWMSDDLLAHQNDWLSE